VGRHGKHFDMLKFRTMVDGADAMKESLRARNDNQRERVSAETRLGIVMRTSPSRPSNHLALTSVSAVI